MRPDRVVFGIFLVECENFSTFNFRQTFAPWHVGDSRNMSGWCNINSNTGNDRLSWVNIYFCGTDISAQTCLHPPMYEDKLNHWTHTFFIICHGSLSKRKLRPIQPCFMCVVRIWRRRIVTSQQYIFAIFFPFPQQRGKREKYSIKLIFFNNMRYNQRSKHLNKWVHCY